MAQQFNNVYIVTIIVWGDNLQHENWIVEEVEVLWTKPKVLHIFIDFEIPSFT